MNIYRTDLAVELKELNNKNFKDLSGVSISEEFIENFKISKVNIETQQASHQLGKSVGIYYTIDILNFKNFISMSTNEITLISKKISEFLNEFNLDKKQLVLVVGLGNREITPDSLGPRIISKIISTRHIKLDINLRDQFKKLRAVAAIAPGVLGQTGIEISEIIKSIVEKINPCAVILIDALVSQNIDRLLNYAVKLALGN